MRVINADAHLEHVSLVVDGRVGGKVAVEILAIVSYDGVVKVNVDVLPEDIGTDGANGSEPESDYQVDVDGDLGLLKLTDSETISRKGVYTLSTRTQK